MESELRQSLAESDSQARKAWAERIVQEGIALESLFPLWHGDQKTAQRFMWLIGDVCEMDPQVVVPCLPFLFSLRDQMPFPGMRRSLAKWLWLTNVPQTVEDQAVPQLLHWLDHDEITIGCKSFSAKALFELAEQDRVGKAELVSVLRRQCRADNRAYASRMKKILDQLT